MRLYCKFMFVLPYQSILNFQFGDCLLFRYTTNKMERHVVAILKFRLSSSAVIIGSPSTPIFFFTPTPPIKIIIVYQSVRLSS